MPKTLLVEGHLRSLNAEKLRHVQGVLQATFGQDIRVSPIYPRDKGRPGFIIFVTLFEPRKPELHIQQRLAEAAE